MVLSDARSCLQMRCRGLTILVAVLVAVSTVIIVLEWQAISGLRSGSDAGDVAKLSDKTGVMINHAEGEAHQELPAFPTPPEVRHRACQWRSYDQNALPKVTMVVPYLHETWDQIRQTIAAIFTFASPELLDEVIFVDDGNDPEWQFHDEILKIHPKLRVYRNDERQGLIRSKVIGSKLVSSPIIMFMEPHCILGRQFLEPLIQELMAHEDHRTIVMPTIDIIPEDNFAKYSPANLHIGGFDYSLTFNWMAIISQRNRSYVGGDSYDTPALSGGIFAIWRDWWEESGTYDVNMSEWGGEHIEMSLRNWRCGGRIRVVPCARVGHVFRARNPYVVHNHLVVRNEKRAALVWLDEHLEDFYKEVPQARHMDAGDVSERLALKERLGCKNMQWYIDNIYPELKTKQPRKR